MKVIDKTEIGEVLESKGHQYIILKDDDNILVLHQKKAINKRMLRY